MAAMHAHLFGMRMAWLQPCLPAACLDDVHTWCVRAHPPHAAACLSMPAAPNHTPRTGKVSSYKGHMQIQIGSSWGSVVKVNGEEVRGQARRFKEQCVRVCNEQCVRVCKEQCARGVRAWLMG